ncbi:MAG: hypothetical protein ACC628_15460 [Pirellulaceae bacterium]
MSIVNCPRCREQVSIPAETSVEASVQCPLCQEEYRLEVALSQLPPVLIVIDDPQGTAIPVSADEDHDGQAFTGLAGPEVAEEDADPVDFAPGEPAPAFQFESGSTPVAAPTRRVRRSRPTRRKGSPMRQVVQIVAGGAAGVIMAQLILWWAPLNLSLNNRDLTGFGRKYGNYVPFLVPSSIRNAGDPDGEKEVAGSESRRLDTEAFADANVPDQGSQIPDYPFAESHLQGPGSLSDAGNTGAPEEPKPRKREGRNERQRASGGPSGAQDENAGEDQDLALPDEAPQSKEPAGDRLRAGMRVDVPSIGLASPVENLSPDIPPPSAGVPGMGPSESEPASDPAKVHQTPGLRNAPMVDGGDVGLRFSEALNANIALDTTEDPELAEKRRLLAEFYRSFASLGEALTFVDPRDEKVAEQMGDVDKLLQEIGEQKEKLDLVGAITPSWMDHSRLNDGVFLFGTVQSVTPQGPYHETRLKLASRDQREVVVVSMHDPGEHYQPGARIFVLGTIVEEPARKLGAYTGDATVVVLDGRHYSLQP